MDYGRNFKFYCSNKKSPPFVGGLKTKCTLKLFFSAEGYSYCKISLFGFTN